MGVHINQEYVTILVAYSDLHCINRYTQRVAGRVPYKEWNKGKADDFGPLISTLQSGQTFGEKIMQPDSSRTATIVGIVIGVPSGCLTHSVCRSPPANSISYLVAVQKGDFCRILRSVYLFVVAYFLQKTNFHRIALFVCYFRWTPVQYLLQFRYSKSWTARPNSGRSTM